MTQVRCQLSMLLTLLMVSAGARADDDGWISLFDGQTLQGWVQKNGTAEYRVEDGTIVGRTTEGSPNSFLCTEKDFGNFELLAEVKVDNELNSGFQVRSQTTDGSNHGRVNGPQVEIAAGNAGVSGYIYGEATARVADAGRSPPTASALQERRVEQLPGRRQRPPHSGLDQRSAD